MSDCGYDNVELSELINDLKTVGRNCDSSGRTSIKTSFQYSSPSTEQLERKGGRQYSYDSDCKTSLRGNNVNYYGSFRNVQNDNSFNPNQGIVKPNEVDNLQMELSKVKEELAMLKRTNSLAGLPIYGSLRCSNDIVGEEKNQRNMVSSQYNLPHSATLNTEIQNKYSNNYGSASNVSYQIPSTNKFQYQSLNRLNCTPAFSAHRDNIDKIRRASSLANRKQEIGSLRIDDYYEDTEDCTLQPIGKGIQTLSASVTSMSRSEFPEHKNSLREFTQAILPYDDKIKAVKKAKHLWLQLDSSRESCKRKLLNDEAGSFIIRIQSGYKFSGGLMFEIILKVTDKRSSEVYEDDNFEYFPLKEFSETNVKGIKLIGHALEPMFYSLESFIVQHLDIPLGLPCCLKLPKSFIQDEPIKSQSQFNKARFSVPFNKLTKKISGSLTSLSSIKSQFTISTYAQPSQEKIEMELLFLGKVKVDRLNGANALRHAVDKILINGYQPKHCIEIKVLLDSLSGVTLIDNERILFFKKTLLSNAIIYSGVDPLHRGLNSDYLSSRGIKNSKIFGIVCQKKKILLKEHQVYVFGEFNVQMQMEKVLRFINKNFVKQNLNQFQ